MIVVMAIAAFAFVVVGLSVVLMYLKSKLVPSQKVKIVVNDKKEIEVSPGVSLLAALAQGGIYLPSACGGGGSCGLCKAKVLEGGGQVLPTELAHLSRRQVKEHWRISCQVKVREPMRVWVPEEVFGIRMWECTVRSNRNVATYIKELVLELPEGERLEFEPGGYIQIYAPPCEIDYRRDIYPNVEEPYRTWWEQDAPGIWNLRVTIDEEIYRAYSMANHPAEGNIVMLNVRIALPPWDRAKNTFVDVPPGKVSSWIFSLKPGDKVRISGPYGEFFIKHTDREMIYIGGGAGMAPLRSHIFHLFKTLKTTRKVSYWYGARSRREIFYEEDFRELERQFPNFKFHIALSEPRPDDNWTGYVGFIHQVLYDNYLKDHPAPEECEYYICGPPPMLRACLRMLDELGVPPENIAYDDFGG